ncbi:hypothetical protein B0H17DRAFT_1092244, partial [Mycena rosella]
RIDPSDPMAAFGMSPSLLPDSSTQASTPLRRTLYDVRNQVIFELAIFTINTAEAPDGVHLGVILPKALLPAAHRCGSLRSSAPAEPLSLCACVALGSAADGRLAGTRAACAAANHCGAPRAHPSRRTGAASRRQYAPSRLCTSRSCGVRCSRDSCATSASRRRARKRDADDRGPARSSSPALTSSGCSTAARTRAVFLGIHFVFACTHSSSGCSA